MVRAGGSSIRTDLQVGTGKPPKSMLNKATLPMGTLDTTLGDGVQATTG